MILKIKGRGFYISDYWPVYLMPGSSRLHKFNHLERNFFFNLRFHHKKPAVEFFPEYLHPKHADAMINTLAGKNFRSLVPYRNWDKVLR